MNSYQTLAVFATVLAGIASLIAYWLGASVFSGTGWLEAIGRKLHEQKIAQIARQPLKFYREAAAAGRFGLGFAIIATGILLKSLVSGLVGLIVIFYLPLGVMTIPALATQHGEREGMRRWVARVTVLQTTSHLLAAAVGFSAAWLWLRTDVNPLEIVGGSPTFTVLMLCASLVVGLWAAWVETTGHIRDGYLEAA